MSELLKLDLYEKQIENKLLFIGSYYEKTPFTFKKNVNESAERDHPDLEKEGSF